MATVYCARRFFLTLNNAGVRTSRGAALVSGGTREHRSGADKHDLIKTQTLASTNNNAAGIAPPVSQPYVQGPHYGYGSANFGNRLGVC